MGTSLAAALVTGCVVIGMVDAPGGRPGHGPAALAFLLILGLGELWVRSSRRRWIEGVAADHGVTPEQIRRHSVAFESDW